MLLKFVLGVLSFSFPNYHKYFKQVLFKQTHCIFIKNLNGKSLSPLNPINIEWVIVLGPKMMEGRHKTLQIIRIGILFM